MKKILLSLAPMPMRHPVVSGKRGTSIFTHDAVAILLFAIGFAPITALALALMGLCSLAAASLVLVMPTLLMTLGLAYRHDAYGRMMGKGYLMGVVAVACYDCVRIPFTLLGWIDDFIPKIGGMLIGDGEPHPVIGYLWRYLGNGGGMGMAFVCAFSLLRNRHAVLNLFGEMKCSLLFGCIVWACLIVTLLLSPHGEDMMFEITLSSLALSLTGHLVFGGTLGFLVKHYGPDRRALRRQRLVSDQYP